MPENELRLLARSFRARAVKILALAETTQDSDARQALLDIAANYEQLAKRVEMESGEA
jgi:hypothetical protein